LRTLPKDLAGRVARHLVMAGRLAEEDPETAYRHAKAARRVASRVGLVREAAGLAAYHAGEWAEALAELRAARRLSTSEDSYLPVMADCERGLGRPERALDLAKAPAAKNLDQAGRIELRIVESGARRDLGQFDAAVVTLQMPELRDRRLRPWSARLFYAYADALVDAERRDEAAEWFARAAAADRDGDTDAAERYAELEGLHILDTEEGADSLEAEAYESGGAEAARDLSSSTEDAAARVQEAPAVQDQAEGDEPGDIGDVPGEPAVAGPTSIEFKAAEAPEPPSAGSDEADGEASAPEVPEAPAVFLEPQKAAEEQDGDRGDEPRD
jgi:tetratricopeptide (TPR) repeat protein